MTQASDTPEAGKAEVRTVFVGMLFALTIAEIAVQIANLVKAGEGPTNVSASYAHLCLALLLVAASWVGWSRSTAAGNQKEVRTPFSWPFVVLLIDVALVICYFILVIGVDLDADDDGKVDPSAHVESLWLLVTFCGYLLWDIVTKWVIWETDSPPKLFSHERIKKFFSRGWVSLFCTALAVVVYLFFRAKSSLAGVLFVDGALLSLVFLFRALKLMTTRIEGPEGPERTSKQKDHRVGAILTAILTLCFVGLLCASCAYS